jgi:hypothetical protein
MDHSVRLFARRRRFRVARSSAVVSDGRVTSPYAESIGYSAPAIRMPVPDETTTAPRPMRASLEPTWRTLADISDEPPADLILGMLEHGPNCLYGIGGVGKGSTGSWLIRELERIHMRSMVYDAEGRPREWARRTSGLGVDRSRVVYVQHGDLPKPLMGRPAWDIAPYLGSIARASGADLLFIDSILPAIGVGEERLKSDAQAPYLYVASLDEIGIPSVSFGHPPRGTPDGEPYGSVSWVNAMRLTWLGTPGEGDGHTVRWRPRKRNERGHISGVLLTFEYEGNVLRDVVREDDEETTREWLLVALLREPRSVEDLAEDLAEESLRETTGAEIERIKARLRQALGRMKFDGLAAKQTTKRNSPWMLTSVT